MNKALSLIIQFIFGLVVICSLPAQATQQYTQAECILIKQQIIDYQQRLGEQSTLTQQSKVSFDKHCQYPIQPKVRQSHLNAPIGVKPSYSTKSRHITNIAESKVQRIEPLSIIGLLWKPLLPLLLLLLLGSIALAYLKKKLPQIKGRMGEHLVIKGLEKHLYPNEYTIINDVTLPLEDSGTTQVDHIIVSRFGIFVIETKNMSGWIFGNEKQAKWTQTIHRSKHQFQNPLRQNYKHTCEFI